MSNTPQAPTPIVKPHAKPRSAPKPKRPEAWNVVLTDSDDHTYEYVIEMVTKLFAHPVEKAFQIAKEVDKQGRAICMTTHRELAELKVEQIRSFGADPRIMKCTTSMRAYCEPTCAGGDGRGDAR